MDKPPQIKVDAVSLAAALKGAAAVINPKETMLILDKARLVSDGSSLEIITSNLKLEYRQTVKAEGDAFSCAIEAKRLHRIASSVDGGQALIMTLDGLKMSMKAGRSKWTAPTLPASDFPVMDVSGVCDPVAIRPARFASIMKAVAWSAVEEMGRIYLAGVFLNRHEGSTCFTATSGRTLANADTGMKWPQRDGEDVAGVIVPSRAVNAMVAACGDAKALSLAWDERKFVARFGDGGPVISANVIDGQFPQYRRIFPAPSEPIAFDVDAMLAAVKRVRIASDESPQRIRLERVDGGLSVGVLGTGGMDATEAVPADCEAGFYTGVNADYFVSMLSAISSETVTVEQADRDAVMMFRPMSQETGVDFTGLLMPMKI